MPYMGCLEWMIRTAAAVEITDEIVHLPKVNWYYVKNAVSVFRGKNRTHYPNFTGDISLYSFQSLYILPYFFYLLINDAKYLMSYYTATTLVLKSSIWGNAKLSTLALCQNSSPAGRWSLNYIFFIRERFDGKFWQIVIFLQIWREGSIYLEVQMKKVQNAKGKHQLVFFSTWFPFF